jgi:hypothetical protein
MQMCAELQAMGQPKVPLIRWTEAHMRVEMLVAALRPLAILQVGSGQRLFRNAKADVARVDEDSLSGALDTLGREEFDAIVLGWGLRDAWSATAYERVAGIAGPISIVAWTDSVEQLTTLKAQHQREQDMIVAAATSSSVIEQLALAATIQRRALAAGPGVQTW